MTTVHGPENSPSSPDANQDASIGDDVHLPEVQAEMTQRAPDLYIVPETERPPAVEAQPKNNRNKAIAVAGAVAVGVIGLLSSLGGGESGQVEGVETAPIGVDAPENVEVEGMAAPTETTIIVGSAESEEITRTEAPETIRYEMTDMEAMTVDQVLEKLNNNERVALGRYLYEQYGGEYPQAIDMAPDSNLEFYLGTANRVIEVAAENQDPRVVMILFSTPSESYAFGRLNEDLAAGNAEQTYAFGQRLQEAIRIDHTTDMDGLAKSEIIIFEDPDQTVVFPLEYEYGLLQITDI